MRKVLTLTQVTLTAHVDNRNSVPRSRSSRIRATTAITQYTNTASDRFQRYAKTWTTTTVTASAADIGGCRQFQSRATKELDQYTTKDVGCKVLSPAEHFLIIDHHVET